MVYLDPMGFPTASATVSFSRNCFSGKSSYYLSGTFTNYDGQESWPGSMNPNEIVKYLEETGWACSMDKDGYGKPRIRCVHKETMKFIQHEKSKQDIIFENAERGYVRYGALPECGKSKNYRDNTLELGVSCFDAEFAKDGTYRLLLTPVLEVSYLTVMTRTAYRLYGEQIGTGADGEPILNVTKAEVLE